MRVDICVISYRRPQGLQRLLGGLQAQRLPAPAPELRVVVVDNDAAESARPVCDAAASWLSHPLVYLVEKRRGIPQARNTALATSLSHADFIAFIDDDEVPEPDWLCELLRVQTSRGADAVAGPCLPAFEEPPPEWIARGGLFERPRHTTGARIEYAYTHNVLVSTPVLAAMDRWFDERMALTGSSDTEFFERFARRGHRIVWADTARVVEWIPPSRARLGWLLRRAFRIGTSTAFIDRHRMPRPRSAPRLLSHGLWCLAKGGLLLPIAALRGRAPAARALRLAVYGAGRIAGMLGVRFHEYRTPHGR